MMLREILQLTPIEHPDYIGLQIACEKAKEIATMADDDPTKVATMFLNLYQSIKDSPVSLSDLVKIKEWGSNPINIVLFD
jgi:hypothetical protein